MKNEKSFFVPFNLPDDNIEDLLKRLDERLKKNAELIRKLKSGEIKIER